MARNYTGTIHLLTAVSEVPTSVDARKGRLEKEAQEYLQDVAEDLSAGGYRWDLSVKDGAPAEVIGQAATAGDVDVVILSTHSHSRLSRWVLSHVPRDVIHQTTPPLLLIRPTDAWRSTRTRFQSLLVALDGSAAAEQVLPHVHEIASKFHSQVTLLSAPEASEADDHAEKLQAYLDNIADCLKNKGLRTKTLIDPSAPVHAILRACEEHRIDLIMMVSHGRGGVERIDRVKLGSVVEGVIEQAPCPIFMVSAEKTVVVHGHAPPPHLAAAERTRWARSSGTGKTAGQSSGSGGVR